MHMVESQLDPRTRVWGNTDSPQSTLDLVVALRANPALLGDCVGCRGFRWRTLHGCVVHLVAGRAVIVVVALHVRGARAGARILCEVHRERELRNSGIG